MAKLDPHADNQLLTLSDNSPPIDGASKSTLTVLILNCQPLVAQRHHFINAIVTHSLDIFIDSESWLRPFIKYHEIFPTCYTVHRCDGYGGIFIACHDALNSQIIYSTKSSCKLVVCYMQLNKHSSLVVCSIYHPSSSGNCI